ncbi:hypothetical protein FRC01_004332, partial [Tulasnella sp. 417]
MQGAPREAVTVIRAEVGDDEDLEEPVSALEMAIMTESKRFLASPLVQEVINEIWSGRVLFSAASNHSLLADNYKARPIAAYHNPKGAPFLDHYRLRVPKYRSLIELLNFSILLFLFVLCLSTKNFARMEWTEIAFCVYTFGFVLDEFASSQEHGWHVYVANMWNGFDLSFIFLFLIYFGCRLRGLTEHDDKLNDLAFDVLACGACILFPRVAFFFISNHVVIVALRAMIVQFSLFIGVAATCFSGLLFTLWKLSGDEWTLKKIAWLMVQIWFGNTYGFVAESFHPIFGPPLMVLFAALSNTLLITILISILSATYAKVDANATQEYLFQSAISTLEGVKTDALFSYQPPFNLVAYVTLLPLSYVVSPRTLHTINVFMIRLTSLPLLVGITVYERYFAPGSKFIETGKDKAYALFESLPRHIKNVSILEAMVGSSSHDLLDAIFDVEISDEILDALDADAPEEAPSGSPRIGVIKSNGNDSVPGTPRRGRFASPPSAPTSPGLRRSQSRTGFLQVPDVTSPLARIFTAGIGGGGGPPSAIAQDDIATSLRRVEGLLEGFPEVQKLRTELKDTKERLERIEALLLNLSRASRTAIIYACLMVKSHFIASADENVAFAPLYYSRATFCELLAIKLLQEFSNFDLVVVCTTPWNALQGAPREAVSAIRAQVGDDEELEEPISALEMAIMTESKEFLASPLVQEVVNEIWSGRIRFSVASSHSLLADNYKTRPIAAYHNPKGAPFLDHYRLRVPKYRSLIESLNFSILLFLFVLCLATQDFARMGWTEIAFCVYTFGFILGEFASSEELGWHVYVANMWNGFDLSFICLFLVYFGCRIRGLAEHNDKLNDLAFDILACGACILFPRVAFSFISNHVVIVALRAMIVQFCLFIGVAATCFSGLLFTLWRLSDDDWTLKGIAWLMVQIWFGNTDLSFSVAASLHPIFGPPLMVLFAVLSNTFLITILISILSATHDKVDANATQEYLFQTTISTLKGAKADALFSYQPPFNLVAYVTLLPLSYIVSPRTFHTINVFMIKLTSLPLLIGITVYERHFAPGSRFIETGKDKAHALLEILPRRIETVSVLAAMVGSSSQDILDAIFNVEISDDVLDVLDNEAPEAAPSGLPQIGVIGSDGNSASVPGTPARGRFVSTASAPASAGLRDSQSGTGFLQIPNVVSPLARIFTAGFVGGGPPSAAAQDEIATSLRRVEGLLEGLPEVQKLRTELKDTKERLERIEALLLNL